MGLFGFRKKEKAQPETVQTKAVPAEDTRAVSEEQLRLAREAYQSAQAMADSYQGDDEDEAEMLKGVAVCRLGELNLASGDPGDALTNFENAAAILDGVAARNPLERYRRVYIDVLEKLGSLQREDAIQLMRANPLSAVKYLQPVYATLMKVIKIERDFVEESPTAENRRDLARTLYRQAELEADKNKMKMVAAEALEIIAQLREEAGDGGTGQGGADQNGADQGSTDQNGADQGGMDQNGADQGGTDQNGIDTGSLDQIEQDIRELLKKRRIKIR